MFDLSGLLQSIRAQGPQGHSHGTGPTLKLHIPNDHAGIERLKKLIAVLSYRTQLSSGVALERPPLLSPADAEAALLDLLGDMVDRDVLEQFVAQATSYNEQQELDHMIMIGVEKATQHASEVLRGHGA